MISIPQDDYDELKRLADVCEATNCAKGDTTEAAAAYDAKVAECEAAGIPVAAAGKTVITDGDVEVTP